MDAKTNGCTGTASTATSSSFKIEKLSNAKNITLDQLEELIDTLKGLESNESRIDHLTTSKNSYLFTSEDMLKIIVDITPSVKTRISFIELIGMHVFIYMGE